MTEYSAVPGDTTSTVAAVSTGPSTKRSRISRKAKAPSTTKAAGERRAVKAAPRSTKTAPRSKVKPQPKPRAKPKTRQDDDTPIRRTSEILLQILEDNPQDLISVEQIVKGLGTSSFGTSLLVFSIPEVIPIPVPGMSAIVALPAGIIAAQMITGRGEIRLPKTLLKRAIPRKAFAGAVKTILPFLKRAEKGVRPRWQWATSRMAKRFLGVLIILLAATMALPIPMTNMPLAIAVFIIGLGLVERDGKMIALGVTLGVASMALIGGAFFGLFSLFGGSL